MDQKMTLKSLRLAGGQKKMREMDIANLKNRSTGGRQQREEKALHDELYDYLDGRHCSGRVTTTIAHISQHGEKNYK
jgi:hypothetical protein